MTSSVPAKLIFLADLPATQLGEKVRFLGCVDYYDTTTGALTTRHEYRSSSHVAKVNIDHVREGLPSITTAVGSWVNVVGYVQEHTASETRVQATMLWDAGAVKLEDYERALQARKDATARK